MKDRDQRTAPGQAIYSHAVLGIYDWYVLGLSARFIWRCPAARLAALYARYATGNHLDVGVGSGYFLDRCPWPSERPRLGLLDPNPNCLEVAGRRLRRYTPEIYRADALRPLPAGIPGFDSISLNFVLHCLPGPMGAKAMAFDHLKGVLNPGGIVFGATLLEDGVSHTRASRRLMSVYNAKGYFSTAHDSVEGLRNALEARFARSRIDVVGCAALFTGET